MTIMTCDLSEGAHLAVPYGEIVVSIPNRLGFKWVEHRRSSYSSLTSTTDLATPSGQLMHQLSAGKLVKSDVQTKIGVFVQLSSEIRPANSWLWHIRVPAEDYW